ncbi:5,10-methylenetetrahydrofolate reductase [Allosaccharopolyspora coralli]|uniref:Methylenetetrahydrofolate reductase n=1 Tax=Allosaccharopolyspora coralli TaxID=2665642 RepID=A0A5Q3Q7U7_9PSEU|nr:methylenetetrahydrofolate reductase [Allosaccharopolyspora coralli]QGK70751.1 5,10-methylenetetrahydrofolate reductase [Allosaccharopolyspora coralli]
MDATSTQQLRSLLGRARFEVLPTHGVLDRVDALPTGTTVTVTSSPSRGPETTVDVAEDLAARGMHAVPHLAARQVVGTSQLSSLLDRIHDAGVSEVFVIAGDGPTPAGPFPDALALLRAITDSGRRPSRIGITGYPERHSAISDEDLVEAMERKSVHADYVVSQICYDSQTIGDWLTAVRRRGIDLPVYIGIPGSVDVTRLLRISLKIGLGDSMRFLRKQRGGLGKLLSRYTADDVVEQLSPYLLEPWYDVAGWHLFTFNEVATTARWRDDLAARIEEVPA